MRGDLAVLPMIRDRPAQAASGLNRGRDRPFVDVR